MALTGNTIDDSELKKCFCSKCLRTNAGYCMLKKSTYYYHQRTYLGFDTTTDIEPITLPLRYITVTISSNIKNINSRTESSKCKKYFIKLKKFIKRNEINKNIYFF